MNGAGVARLPGKAYWLDFLCYVMGFIWFMGLCVDAFYWLWVISLGCTGLCTARLCACVWYLSGWNVAYGMEQLESGHSGHVTGCFMVGVSSI